MEFEVCVVTSVTPENISSYRTENLLSNRADNVEDLQLSLGMEFAFGRAESTKQSIKKVESTTQALLYLDVSSS